ncbi:MAG TPA: hypothetical protein VEX43_03090 [Chthoniobacterales bacterium]|nr:hypothetical protein [Chthoniobacterales bacterium]
MHILDILLLAFALIVLFGIAGGRAIGTLPTRGLRRLAQSASTPHLSDHNPAGAHLNAAKQPDAFRGILVHHEEPLRFVQPNRSAS